MIHVLPITLIFYVFKKKSNFCCFKRLDMENDMWISLHIHLFDTQPTLAQFSFSHSFDSTSFYFYMDILHFASMWKYFRTTGTRGAAQSRPATAVPAHFCSFCCSLLRASFQGSVCIQRSRRSATTLRPLGARGKKRKRWGKMMRNGVFWVRRCPGLGWRRDLSLFRFGFNPGLDLG